MTYNVDLRVDDVLDVNFDLSDDPMLNLDVNESVTVGSSDYNKLKNKPRINSVELVGDKSFDDLGMNTISNIELEEIFSL